MMNQGGNTETVAPLDHSLLEKHQALDASQSYASSYVPSTTGSEAAPWTTQRADNSSTENGNLSNPSSIGTTYIPQEYNGYAYSNASSSYPNGSDPYGYSNTGYQPYYSSSQQQPNHSYTQPIGGAYQNTGAPYQPISSFQNTGSYTGPTSYSSTTYYNPGDYQTSGSYSSSAYSNQTNSWSNEGTYANYSFNQYSNYTTPDPSGAYNSTSSAPANSLHCQQQQYNPWADYYNQTEVSCAPGTENLSVTGTSNVGYISSNSLPPPPQPLPPPPPPPPSISSWRPEGSTELSSFQPGAPSIESRDNYWKLGAPNSQNHYASVPQQPYPQNHTDIRPSYGNGYQDQPGTMHQVPHVYQSPLQTAHHVPQNYQPSLQTGSSLGVRRTTNLQIPTNPRIASNVALGLPKTDNSSTIASAAKPAYVSVSQRKPHDKVSSHDAADSILKPGMFPKSLRGYVERALGRCKDDTQMAACQSVMKEMITKATADGTLLTRDWDTEPLFPLPNSNTVYKDSLPGSTHDTLLAKNRKSPTRRSKSRWEPVSEEKPVEKQVSVDSVSAKYGGWLNYNDRSKKINSLQFPSGKYVSKEENSSNTELPPFELRGANKNVQRPVKKQRFSDASNAAANNGDASSDSDKEQKLTAYYASAIALSNTPEEKKRRENRSKRFEKRTEVNHVRSKNNGVGNFYSRRASASVLSKNYDDGGNKAVEDMDWDALTVKGTSQEIEKRYLRLTSAPDPATVRPEEVLEKALVNIQNSQKNYLYKCDQLKSIRQDLTVQRIRNELTVKVYETHARLALEAGDLPEYNQCQSQLMTLYAEGIEGCHMEFSAYNLLCVILHSYNNRNLSSSMSRLSKEAKKDEAVKHALAVRAAVTAGNYVLFFRLYKTAPNLITCLMDLYVEKMRYEAVKCMSRSYRPTIPVSYIAQVLGFTNEVSDEKDMDCCLEECVEWLKAHGACLILDNSEGMQLDAKASSSSLYMPEPEDAVAHGDANLAVNDFLTRAS